LRLIRPLHSQILQLTLHRLNGFNKLLLLIEFTHHESKRIMKPKSTYKYLLSLSDKIMYSFVLPACFDGVPPLSTYSSIGVIMPTLHFYELLLKAAIRYAVNSFKLKTCLPAEALVMVC
jgi:hypothetical protein